MTRALSVVAALLLALASLPAAAGKVDVGDPMPELKLKDSSGKTQTLTVEVRRIYAGADRATDKLLKAALKIGGQATLDAQKAIVIADISDVPFFIKGIVRSDLKERTYKTWMDEDEVTRKFLPYREDRITVIDLDNGKVTAVRFVANAADLKLELEPPANPGEPGGKTGTDTTPTSTPEPAAPATEGAE